MDSIEEKRVYGDREGAVDAYVSSSIGVVRVSIAGDAVGEFGLCDRCTARDIAATDGAVAVATDEDVRVLELEEGDTDAGSATDGGTTVVETGFGPAVAVGYDGSDLLAASPGGHVGCRPSDTGRWERLEEEAIDTVRAIDGDLIGTDSGVYRVHDGGLDHAGLTDVRDVSAAGVPLAATEEGLHKLGNGWMTVREGAFEAVAADPRTEPGELARAHAGSGETVYAYSDDDGEWRESDRLTGPVVGFAYGETVYAVTEAGSFLSATDGEWRSQPLGIAGVTGVGIPLEN